MRFLLAPAAFKGSLRPHEAARAMARGLADVPGATVRELPLADGGEGTLDALLEAKGGERRTADVVDAWGEPVVAAYGLLEGGRIAIVEAAEAVGLWRRGARPLEPARAFTEGLGQLLRAALQKEPEEVWMGLGGSATVDGGAGMLRALGARLLDARGQALDGTPASLDALAEVDLSGLDGRFLAARKVVLADVKSPLEGPRGARLYMRQKGVAPEEEAIFEARLCRLADALEAATGRLLRDEAGAGAAGGLGAALLALGARLVSGAEFVLDAASIDEAILAADIVFTGEGRLDDQTGEKKLIAALARRCQAKERPLVALVGAREGRLEGLEAEGLTTAISIAPGPASLEDLVGSAAAHLEHAARAVGRLLVAL